MGILSSILGALGNNTVGQSALSINGPMTDTSQGGGLLGGDPNMSAQGGGAMGAGNSSGGLFGAGGLLDFSDPQKLMALQLIANGSRPPGEMLNGLPQIAQYGARLQQDRQERAVADRDRRDKLEQTNKTADWIRANRPDFATYLDAGVSPADVFKMATAPVKMTTTQERQAAIAEAGLDPQSREAQHYLLTGDLPDLGKSKFEMINGVPTWINESAQTVEPVQGFETAPTDEYTKREKAAAQFGLDPSSPAFQSFVLTGKMPREDAQALTATDKKALWSAEDELPVLDNTIASLERAKELNDKTYTGTGADWRGWAGAKLPGGNLLFDEQTAKDTVEFGNLMSMEAINAMAQTLKGATTDQELARFVSILADPSSPPDIRARTIKRMLTLAQRVKDVKISRINELRGNSSARQKITTPDGYTIEEAD